MTLQICILNTSTVFLNQGNKFETHQAATREYLPHLILPIDH